MATKINRLKTEALEGAKWRGHRMGQFKHVSETAANSTCTACGMSAYVNTKPAPNDIEVGGRAVALNCTVA